MNKLCQKPARRKHHHRKGKLREDVTPDQLCDDELAALAAEYGATAVASGSINISRKRLAIC
jgi:hypothetical protein